jgi:hypothetical protein
MCCVVVLPEAYDMLSAWLAHVGVATTPLRSS